MNIANTIKSLIPEFDFFAESEVHWEGRTVGFQSTIVTHKNSAFAGGFGFDLNSARRICAAEGIERAIYYKSLKDEFASKRLWLDRFPTTCGFAAGFDSRGTVFRAECEAVERWAWERWVDDGCVVPEMSDVLIPASHAFFASVFDKVVVFEKEFGSIGTGYSEYDHLVFTAVVGVKGSGIFPGSRVSGRADNRLGHALVEAWRHSQIYRELQTNKPSDIIEERIAYFGSHGSTQLDVLQRKQGEWVDPSIVMSSSAAQSTDYFVHRAICDGLTGWDRGDEKRFVF